MRTLTENESEISFDLLCQMTSNFQGFVFMLIQTERWYQIIHKMSFVDICLLSTRERCIDPLSAKKFSFWVNYSLATTSISPILQLLLQGNLIDLAINSDQLSFSYVYVSGEKWLD